MKVGDKFEKDGKYFVVDRLLSNGNYAFHEVKEKQISSVVEDEPVVEKTRRRGRKSGE
jgi:hypothetical protein